MRHGIYGQKNPTLCKGSRYLASKQKEGLGRKRHHWFADISHLICHPLLIPADISLVQR